MSDISIIVDSISVRSQASAARSIAGAMSVQNVAAVLTAVTDQAIPAAISAGSSGSTGSGVPTISIILDGLIIRSRAAAAAANPGCIAIQNIGGSFFSVTDQGATTAITLGGAGSAGTGTDSITRIVDSVSIRSRTTAAPANPGSLAIQNVNSALVIVTDQGVPTPFGAASVPATLQWLAASNASYAPSDSYDAAACYCVAVATGTGLPLAGGSIAALPFTLDGGAPTLGQTVWAASYLDDGSTGRTKATATLPVRVTPNVGVYVKNIAPIGTVASTTNLGTGGAPVYAVTMAASPAPTHPSIPANTSIAVNHVNFPGTTNFNAAVSLTAQLDIADGETMIVKTRIPEIAQGSALGIPIGCVNAGQTAGWLLRVEAGGTTITFDPRGGGSDLGFNAVAGVNTVVISRHGGFFHVGANGYPVQTTADTGGSAGATSGLFSLRDRAGSVYGIVKLNRALSDAEVLSVSASTYITVSRVANTNLYTLPLTGDANCQWFLDLTAYVSGTPHAQAGTAGTAFDFTVSGSPVVLTTTVNYLNATASLLPLMIGGPAPAVDSDGFLSPRAFTYFGGACTTQGDFADMIIGMNNLDFDDADEESGFLAVNGVPFVPFTADVNLGVNTYQRTITGYGTGDSTSLYSQISPSGGVYNWRFYIGEKMSRWGSFTSGNRLINIAIPSTTTAQVMNSPTASKVMALIASGAPFSGHGDDLLVASAVSGAVASRMGADYPGIIIAPNVMTFAGYGGGGFNYMKAFGDGTIGPYMRLVHDAVQAAAAGGAVKCIVFCEGLVDWQANVPLATFTADYGAAMDLSHALDPTYVIIVLKTIANSTVYSTINGNGDTLQAFVDATTTLCGSRGFVTLLDVSGPSAIAWTTAGSAIGLAPTQASGAAALKGNVKTRIQAAKPTVW